MDKTDELKIKIADVILKLNECERCVKVCINYYLGTKNESFVMDILLNNHIIPFGNKLKLLFYILNEQKIEHKELKKALNIILTKRNAIAHSDNPLSDIMLVKDGENDDGTPYFKVEDAENEILMYDNGTFNNEKLEKVLMDFDKYYKIAQNGLISVSLKIKLGK